MGRRSAVGEMQEGTQAGETTVIGNRRGPRNSSAPRLPQTET